MIDERVKAALRSPEVEVRKRAVTALGKSLDRAALPYLAEVYRSDPDPALREMAKKAGVYIKNNAPEQMERIARTDDIDTGITAVSGVSEQRARAALEEAMQRHVAGENNKTIAALQKAFSLDPRLRRDNYARSLAAQVMMTRDEDEAIREIMRQKAITRESSDNSGVPLIALIMIGGALMVVGFFLVWMQAPELLEMIGGDATELSNITGMDIVVNTDGAAEFLTAIEVGLSSGGSLTMNNRSFTTYSPALTAIAGVVQVLVGLVVFLGDRPKGWYWIQALAFGGAGTAGLAWLYVTINDLTTLGFGLLGNTTDWLGIGFWISSAGTAAVLICAALFAVTASE